ncbi:hypothetical protein SAMN05421507_103181 [Lentzea jiangxiensis]|uniref:Uncharacterized protein n=1 Tax=Lentzea jiangxiensis TaxID=641025 RepID=A0A1H0L401_9PSEU|nr:hypothetical protein SAMN05421507_103181 [Lentzea jiangxiensis]
MATARLIGFLVDLGVTLLALTALVVACVVLVSRP